MASGPDRYWAKLQAPEPIGTSYVGWDGSKIIYLDDFEPHRQSRQVNIPGIIVTWASDPAYRTWETFLKRDIFDPARYSGAFVALHDEIEGRACDVVGMVYRQTDPEPSASVRYYWIDQETKLPLALQMQVFVRGKSDATKRIFFRNVKLNPSWPGMTFREVPEKATKHVKLVAPTTKTVVPKVGALCPDLTVQDVALKETRLRNLIHGPTLVTFWAPWCGPCQDELKARPKVPEVRDGRIKVYAIGVSDAKRTIRKMIKDRPSVIRYLVDPDAERSSSDLKNAFGVDGIPHSYLFDGKGKLVNEWSGFTDLPTLLEELRLFRLANGRR